MTLVAGPRVSASCRGERYKYADYYEKIKTWVWYSKRGLFKSMFPSQDYR
jgi:hypothetical protein